MLPNLMDEMFDPHDLPRPVTAVGMELVTQGWERQPHAHRKAQLVLNLRGLVTCDVVDGRWMVPPHCALWIPSGLTHNMLGSGTLQLYCLFLDPELARGLPAECCTITVSPLLRELVIAASHLPALYDVDGPAAPLIQTMLNELAAAPLEQLHLPMPADPRLRRLADALLADPADRATIGTWASRIAMSERSLHRLIQRETGMTFLRWRQQFQVMVALERLAQGIAVQTIAMDLGYESASAFITMFRKVLGQSPGRYLAERAKMGRDGDWQDR